MADSQEHERVSLTSCEHSIFLTQVSQNLMQGTGSHVLCRFAHR